MQALPQPRPTSGGGPSNAEKAARDVEEQFTTLREIVLADTLREVTRFQLWSSRQILYEHGTLRTAKFDLIAAFPWLEEAVQLIRAMSVCDAKGIMITEGTRVLWTEGVDGELRDCDSYVDAQDAVQNHRLCSL